MKIYLTRQAGESVESFDDRIQKISIALRAQFKKTDGSGDPVYWYPQEVFDGYVIVGESDTSKSYKIPYTVEGDAVRFGARVEVEEVYVPVTDSGQVVAQSERVLAMASAEFVESIGDKTFKKTRWSIAKFGPAAQKQLLTKQAFDRSVDKWKTEGSKCFLNHPPKDKWQDLPERDAGTQLGYWSDHRTTAQAFEATLTLVPSADQFRLDLKAAVEDGKSDFFQPSILGLSMGRDVQYKGETWFQVEDFKYAFSTDMVNVGGASSEFQYAVQSARGEAANLEGATTMDKKVLALLFKTDPTRFALVRQAAVAAKAEGVTDQSNEDQVAGAIAGNETMVSQALALMEKPEERPTVQSGRPADGNGNRERVGFDQLPDTLRTRMIAQSISESQLPESVQQQITARVTATTTLEDIDREIETRRETLAITAQSRVNNPGRTVTGGADSADKIAIGLAKGFQLDMEAFNGIEGPGERLTRQSGSAPFKSDQATWASVPAIISIRELYVELTGDREITGVPKINRRLTRQAQTPYYSTDFTHLFDDVMHKRLLASYREVDYGWQRVASIKPLKDFRTQHIRNWGGFGDLPIKAENADAVTFTRPTDSEESYAPQQREGLVELTRVDILNDDIGAFALVIIKLGRSAHRTLAKFVWITNLFANPVLVSDGITLFHAVSHGGNLISDDLGATGFENALIVMGGQTEQGSNEKISIGYDGLTVAVPQQRYWKASRETDFNMDPKGNQDAQTTQMRRLGITPIALPILTDPNDWMLCANPRDVEIVEIGFINGNVEPEFFSLTGELHEKAFNSDIVTRHKVRHEYGGAVVDYRGVVKSVVP